LRLKLHSVILTLLFITSFSYFTWFGNGLFFFQENRSLFIFSGEYLREFLMVPGGMTEYIGNFIKQGYFSTLFGSLVASLFLLLFAAVLYRLYKALSGDNPVWFILILGPTCLLLFMQMRSDHFIHHTIGYLFLAYFTWISVLLNTKRLKFLVPLLFLPFIYLTGSFALIFPVIFTLNCLLNKEGTARYTSPGILIITAILALILFEKVLFVQPPEQFLGYPLPLIHPEDLHPLDAILCIYLILFPLIIRTAGSIKIHERTSQLISQRSSFIVLLVTIVLLVVFHDSELAKLTRIEKFFLHKEWDKVIVQYEEDPPENVIGQYYYNLALSEKGQLCSRLFHGNKDFSEGSLVLSPRRESLDRSKHYYYTVGFINEAHHQAYESMVINGYRPGNVKMLIKTDLINGNYRAAERYIEILKKTLHYRKWAEKHEKLLQSRDLISTDPELGEKIKLMPRTDFLITRNDVINIDLMLRSNPDNKLAFEYKIARLLLEKDYKAAVYQVKKMRDMNYSFLPRHIEEAIILFIGNNYELPYLGDFDVSRELENSFDQFSAAKQEHKKGTDIEGSIQSSWGNTFWYYFEYK